MDDIKTYRVERDLCKHEWRNPWVLYHGESLVPGAHMEDGRDLTCLFVITITRAE